MTKIVRPRKPTTSQRTGSAPKSYVNKLGGLERQGVLSALRACENKKAADITLLELEKGTSAFTDFFVICSGSNPRQMQAISDEVEEQLAKSGNRPLHVEGYKQADWILLDYVDFVVHIFSENTRKFYDLERLWKSARRIPSDELQKSLSRPSRKRAAGTSARRKPPASAAKGKK